MSIIYETAKAIGKEIRKASWISLLYPVLGNLSACVQERLEDKLEGQSS